MGLECFKLIKLSLILLYIKLILNDKFNRSVSRMMHLYIKFLNFQVNLLQVKWSKKKRKFCKLNLICLFVIQINLCYFFNCLGVDFNDSYFALLIPFIVTGKRFFF